MEVTGLRNNHMADQFSVTIKAQPDAATRLILP